MTLDPNDPRLTALALGELDPREAAQLEADLVESPEGQRAHVEIRATAELLRQVLAAGSSLASPANDAAPALSPAARAAIFAAGAEAIATNGQVLENAAAADASAEAREPHETEASRPISPAARQAGWQRQRQWLARHGRKVVLCSLIVAAAVVLLLPALQPAREAGPWGEVAMNDFDQVRRPQDSLLTELYNDPTQRSSESTELPSPYSQTDEVDFKPGPDFKLTNEAVKVERGTAPATTPAEKAAARQNWAYQTPAQASNVDPPAAKPIYEVKQKNLGYTIAKPIYGPATTPASSAGELTPGAASQLNSLSPQNYGHMTQGNQQQPSGGEQEGQEQDGKQQQSQGQLSASRPEPRERLWIKIPKHELKELQQVQEAVGALDPTAASQRNHLLTIDLQNANQTASQLLGLLSSVELEMEKMKLELSLAEDLGATAARMDEDFRKDERLKKMEEELSKIEQAIAEAKSTIVGTNNAGLKRLQKSRAALEEQIEARKEGMTKKFSDANAVLKVKDFKGKLAAAEKHKTNVEDQLAEQQDRIKNLTEQLSTITTNSADLPALRQKLKKLEEMQAAVPEAKPADQRAEGLDEAALVPGLWGGVPPVPPERSTLKLKLAMRAEALKRKIVELENAEGANTEAYAAIIENPFQAVAQQPLSTFSIDVDTASYANVRRFLNQNTLPPPGAVRIEEMVNYFRYDYAGPKDNTPFAANAVVAACPWAPAHRLVRIGLKGRAIAIEDRPASNLVFLIDVSGSMQDANKLPLVKEGLRLLVEKLGENDRVAMVVYAGASGLVLPSTLGNDREKIMHAIDQLQAGGSTNGASGIELAYQTAVGNFIKGGANRVILATDGDFNVGITDESQLVALIEKKAASGVFLSVLGFGMGNLKDANLEKLADKGNGNYAYIDALPEARKVLVEELSGTLVTIAKDVKIQIEFNPAKVQAYRLIGYENRMLAKEDFNDDKKDAGEIGAGHTVTALYEVVPAGAAAPAAVAGVDELEYQTAGHVHEAAAKSNDLLTLKLRYKDPDGDASKLLKFPVQDQDQKIGAAGDDFEFAAAVAAFGMLLRGSAHKGAANFGMVLELAQAGQGADREGYRHEFIDLVKKAKPLAQE